MASLNIITGVPGSGKSLYTVAEVIAKMDQDRTVYSNINGLQIPGRDIVPIVGFGPDEWAAMSSEERAKHRALNNWPDWAGPNAVIVFDEVQKVWRPRPTGSKVPAEIAALETVRHGGVEMWIITQGPLLVDANIRRLVGRHIHVRRIWGMQRSMLYEWDHCSDPGRVSNAVKRMWSYPKRAYAWYKSAEVHNKAGGRIPVALWFLLVAVLCIPVALFFAGRGMANQLDTSDASAKIKGQTVDGAASGPATAGPAPVPAASAASQAEPEKPRIVGCLSLGKRCECIDADGRSVEVDLQACIQTAQRGGVLLPYFARSTGSPAALPAYQPAPVSPEPQGPSSIALGGDPRAHVRE